MSSKYLPPVNHQCFEAAAADILSRAYEAFPGLIHIDGKEDYERMLEENQIPPHCGELNNHPQSVVMNTAHFLHREGLINMDSDNPWNADNVTLTSKGFTLLRSPRNLIQSEVKNGLPFGEALRSGAKKAGSTALSATIGALVKQLTT